MSGRLSPSDPRRGRLLRWALAAAVGGFAFGYHVGVISGALLSIRRDFALSSFEQGALVSVLPLGAMAGGLLAGRLADALGRRRTLIAIAVVFLAGTALSVVAPGFGVLLSARAITGVAVGAVSSTVPIYLAEIAPTGMRGRLVTVNQLMVTLGIVVSYCVDLVFARSGDWRAMLAGGLVPSAVLLLGMLRAPETPAWLQNQGRGDAARDVVLQVMDEEEAERLLDDIDRAREDAKNRLSVGELLRSSARPALTLGLILAALQQLSGINSVIYYAPSIMERTGLNASDSILYSVIIGVMNVAATVVSIRLVDRSGRRPLLLFSLAGMLVSLVLLGLSLTTDLGALESPLALLCLLGYIAAFAIGLGPIVWILLTEIFPPNARAAGTSVATATIWISNFLVGLLFLPLADALGDGETFWVFAAVCAAGLVFVNRYVPETRGRAVADIVGEVRARLGGQKTGVSV